MAIFRQKEYALPAMAAAGKWLMGALNVAGVASVVPSIKQGNKSMAQAARHAAEQAKQNEQMTRAINNLAKKNPVAGNNVASILSQRPPATTPGGGVLNQVSYSNTNISLFSASALGKVGSDLWKKHRGFLGGMTIAGTIGAGVGYAVDKGIQMDKKRMGFPVDSPQSESESASETKTYSFTKGLSNFAKESVGHAKKGAVFTVGFAAIPAFGYISERKQLKDQMKASNSKNIQEKKVPKPVGSVEKTYSTGKVLGNMALSMKRGWDVFKKHPAQSVLGSVSSNIAMGGGRKGVAKFGDDLINLGKKHGSKFAEKAGTFIKNNPKTAIAGSIPVGLGLTAVTWEAGDKMTRKALGKVDKNAFAYEKSKSKTVDNKDNTGEGSSETSAY